MHIQRRQLLKVDMTVTPLIRLCLRWEIEDADDEGMFTIIFYSDIDEVDLPELIVHNISFIRLFMADLFAYCSGDSLDEVYNKMKSFLSKDFIPDLFAEFGMIVQVN
jgi:hypothetical protein